MNPSRAITTPPPTQSPHPNVVHGDVVARAGSGWYAILQRRQRKARPTAQGKPRAHGVIVKAARVLSPHNPASRREVLPPAVLVHMPGTGAQAHTATTLAQSTSKGILWGVRDLPRPQRARSGLVQQANGHGRHARGSHSEMLVPGLACCRCKKAWQPLSRVAASPAGCR